MNMLVYACGIYGYVDVSKDHLMAIPYLLGIFTGGFIGMYLKKRLEEKLTQTG